MQKLLGKEGEASRNKNYCSLNCLVETQRESYFIFEGEGWGELSVHCPNHQ
jgi:hypothetical protein